MSNDVPACGWSNTPTGEIWCARAPRGGTGGWTLVLSASIRKSMALLLFFAAWGSSFPTAARADDDGRTTITLDEAERDALLAGMRQYLASIQGIVTSLAANHTGEVEESAKLSGAKMLMDVSPATAARLPVGFISISFDTHDKFDNLAELAARSGSRTEVLAAVRDILNNCTSCHAMYRLVVAP